MTWRAFAFTLIAVGLVAPNGAVAADANPRRPLVVIPGILGSKLCDKKGDVLWGKRSSLRNLNRLSLYGSSEQLNSCGLIEEVQILGPVWSVRAYAGLIDTLETFGYKRGKDLFLFHYDWRQSNFDSATRFGEFVEAAVPKDQPFDVVAHSMGGIVVRVYMHADQTSRQINKVIYLGTPFLGSANTFGALADGWGTIENAIAGGKETIRTAVVSFPGFLELLPRYPECCYVRQEDGKRQYLDPFDASNWLQLGWLPDSIEGNREITGRFSDALRRSRSLSSILSGPVPASVKEVKIAGDVHMTRRIIGMQQANTSPEGWSFGRDRGDGTVPLWSAAGHASTLDGVLPSFAEHGTIFDDRTVRSQLERELIGVAPIKDLPISRPAKPTVTVGAGPELELWTIAAVEFGISDPTASVGNTVTAELVVTFESNVDVTKGKYLPKGKVTVGTQVADITWFEATTNDDLQRSRLRYRLNDYRVSSEETIQFEATLSDQLVSYAFVQPW